MPDVLRGKLNLAFMDLAKAFFCERGHQLAETFVERGYKREAEVKKHAGVRPGHPPDAGELVGAPGSTRNMWMRVLNVGLTRKVCSRAMAGASRQMGRHLKTLPVSWFHK